jgi:RNA polymerase sigma-70 factor (ECF subfamily)
LKTNQSTTKLVETYYPYVLKYLLRFTKGDLSLSEDIAQEAALQALLKAPMLRDLKHFRNWFVSIALNMARNDFRRSKWRSYDNPEHYPALTCGRDFETEYAAKETLAQVAAVVATLPPRQHQAFELRVVEGLPFIDVAEIMNCPYDTAKANCRHALNKIKAGQ